MSKVEELKASSRGLRGALAEESASETTVWSREAEGLLKFHGVYQQHDRDLRKANNTKVYSAMARVSVPGGVVTASQYLELDRLADAVGDSTLRVTSRQDVQYHRVAKTNVKQLLAALSAAGRSTLAACGDVVRNVTCCAAPFENEQRRGALALVRELDRSLKPRSRAYAEIWLDGERAVSLEAPVGEEPLYGAVYLPRKFKIGVAFEGENTIDVYTNDAGLVAHPDGAYTLLAGGGLGMSAGVKETKPRLADPIAELRADEVVEAVTAVVTIHRDFGNRENRKLARLKYVIDARGLKWFRAELSARLGRPLRPPRPLAWHRQSDYLGWHRQGDGRWFFGLRVVNGRLAGKWRDAVREVVRALEPEVRFTAQQNVLFAGIAESAKPELEAILRAHGVPLPHELPSVLRHSMACVALPTCGQALAEGERALPDTAAAIQEELRAAGAGESEVVVRMTGCPNGCARPYTAEIGIVGQSVDLYAIYLGGSPAGTRLASLFREKVPGKEIAAALRPVISAWAAERLPGESFGDWHYRTHELVLEEVR